jgi:hypothetical protein
LDLILMFALGWALAYFFFRRRQSASSKIYDKLSPDARHFLLQDPRQTLGLAGIIDLFRDKIIDEHLDVLDEPFPYKRCPRCGSKHVRRFVVRADGTPDVQGAPDTPPLAGEDFKIICRSCGYRDEVVRKGTTT